MVEGDTIKSIHLGDVIERLPALEPHWLASIAHATAVCLDDQDHQSGVQIAIVSDFKGTFEFHWDAITEQMRRTWEDEQYATEHGAYCLAFLLIMELTGLSVIERSRKGPGFDYWLGEPSELPFQNKARMEVSGIRNGTRGQINQRVREKMEQVSPSDGTYPAIIVVIEFSRPEAQVHQP